MFLGDDQKKALTSLARSPRQAQTPASKIIRRQIQSEMEEANLANRRYREQIQEAIKEI